MKVYNSLTRTKEEFVPREAGKVAVYVCGPTVYNYIHIGNARTFLSFDVIRRYLEHKGFDVRFVQNITDVDDKIINRAAEEGRAPAEIAEQYAEAFYADMRALGVKDPTVRPKATETIPQMVATITRLIEGGHAYEADGDVYFSVRSFPAYGLLSGRDIDAMETQARVESGDRKRDSLDFALWKAAKPGEPHWPSPWGEGRPGWHIECSVMSEMELGLPFDIHGGGSDLIFPHHENEIAQSEAAFGVPFVRYWLHGGMLQINAEKMSKSLGNFTLARDVLARYPVPVIRLLMLQTHYRSSLDFSDVRLDETAIAYERLDNLVRNLRWARESPASGAGVAGAAVEDLRSAIHETREKFDAEMDDDFNTAGALAAIFEIARIANGFLADHQSAIAETDRQVLCEAEDAVVSLLGVLGVDLACEQRTAYPPEVLGLAREVAGYEGTDAEAGVEALLAARASARADKNWALADAVRDGLAKVGLLIEDTAQGARVVFRPEG
ncbi:MAG: cysteine--tRNA ligase [Coriobacteriia bacterium]|nr:cysteine--tRNA ligase [Coriobacteriia bacterium]